MEYASSVKINGREISIASPTYFIADVASNHDGSLERAKDLIWKAKEAGADAAKFQHFQAEKIVSDYGFKNLGGKVSHQAGWQKSVFDVFRQYECNREWTQELIKTAREANIDFMTTPYDSEAVELLDEYLPAYKIGSGDITWTGFLELIAKKGKPVILATGASDFVDTQRAVSAVLSHNRQLVLLQCNTNYTGERENFRYVNLNVLRSFATMYPNMVLGLSDHTPHHAAVLGAVTLGARVVEKHFTDDNSRIGPDHPFSLNPQTWREMVERTRELELALGDGIKRIEKNETQTSVVQRRCLRLSRDLRAGEVISAKDVESLRPAPAGALPPFEFDRVLGKPVLTDKTAGDALYYADIEGSLWLNGEYVGLRAIERHDLGQLLDWRNRPEYRRYFREYRELGLSNQEAWFENAVLKDPKTIMFAVVDRESKRLLGASGLCYIDWINKTADFSIYIGADGLYIDDKLAPDAGRVMARYGFDELGLHRLWSEIYDYDEPKKRLFATLGFSLDGRHREAHWGEGKWHDSLFYGLLAGELT